MAEIDYRKTYDAVIVGSGAAGGMAAHVLTQHGLDVLMLEAGRKLPIEQELKSMQWPYEHPRRGALPPGLRAITPAEYALRQPPYAAGMPEQQVFSYVQDDDYGRNILVNEKDHPYTGTNFAWVRARCLGGKTNIWGRLSLRLSDLDLQAATHDGYGDNWPIRYADIEPYYDKVDLYLGIAGLKENLPHLPDSLFQTPFKLNAAEVTLREAMAKMDRVVTPYRAGVTSDGLKHNKYRSRCFRRGACNRRTGGCDIHAAFDSPTGLIQPALDTGRLTLRTNATVHQVTMADGGRASGVSFLDTETRQTYQVKARTVVLAASTLESTRLLLLSKIANSSGHVGHNICEHFMGPSVLGLAKDRVGLPPTMDDGRPGGFYVPRFRNLKKPSQGFIRGYGFEGGSGHTMFPENAYLEPGYGAQYKRAVRERAGAYITMGGFGEVLPRFENYVDLDPKVKDRWGIPVLRFHYKFGDNERRMAADMADAAREMFEAAKFEVLKVDRELLTEGWSIHELGTARMGSNAKTSVVNSFQQAHDVRNLFVVDGATFVNAACQNPTWTIMALCWRSCDYLAGELKRGNL